jgi:hypothetical protein
MKDVLLTASIFIAGKPRKPGETISVDNGLAATLIYRGKAKDPADAAKEAAAKAAARAAAKAAAEAKAASAKTPAA